MSRIEYDQLLRSIDMLSPEQMRQLRRELEGKLATFAVEPSGAPDLGSIGAMGVDAEFLDDIVAAAMKARREQPWRVSPGE